MCGAGLGIIPAAVSLNPICKQIGSAGYPVQLLLAFEDSDTDNRGHTFSSPLST